MKRNNIVILKSKEYEDFKEKVKMLKESHENQQKLINLQEIVISKLENDSRHEKDLYNNLLSSYDKQQELFDKMNKLIENTELNALEKYNEIRKIVSEGVQI